MPNPAKYLVLPTPMTYSRYRCYEILCLVYHESKLQVYVGIAKYLVLPTTITNSRNSIGVYKLLFLSTAKLQVKKDLVLSTAIPDSRYRCYEILGFTYHLDKLHVYSIGT